MILVGENSLVLGAMVLVDTANIAPARGEPDKAQEDGESDEALDKSEKNGIGGLWGPVAHGTRRRIGKKLVHEDKESEGKRDIEGGDPTIHLKLFPAGGLLVFQSDISRVAQGFEAEQHGGAKGDNSANERPGLPWVLVAGSDERLGMDCELSVGLANGDAPGVRGAHHDTFQHSLAADEGLLRAFQRKRKLEGGVKAQMRAQGHDVH